MGKARFLIKKVLHVLRIVINIIKDNQELFFLSEFSNELSTPEPWQPR